MFEFFPTDSGPFLVDFPLNFSVGNFVFVDLVKVAPRQTGLLVGSFLLASVPLKFSLLVRQFIARPFEFLQN